MLCWLVPVSTAYYPIPVRRAATLLHTSFRPYLTTTPLCFASPSPPSSWTRDLHPQVGKHAWHTTKNASMRSTLAFWVDLGRSRSGGFSSTLVKEADELLAATWLLQLADGLRLDLTDALAGHFKDVAHFLQGVAVTVS